MTTARPSVAPPTPDSDSPSSLVIQRRLPAPPARVWQAWTDPELVRRWFSPGAMRVDEAELDVRVGGSYRIVMRSPEGEPHSPAGVYQQVVPGEKLVFSWKWAEAELVTRVTVELRPVGDGETELTLTHEGFVDAADRENHGQGWNGCLAKLPQLVAEPAGAAS